MLCIETRPSNPYGECVHLQRPRCGSIELFSDLRIEVSSSEHYVARGWSCCNACLSGVSGGEFAVSMQWSEATSYRGSDTGIGRQKLGPFKGRLKTDMSLFKWDTALIRLPVDDVWTLPLVILNLNVFTPAES